MQRTYIHSDKTPREAISLMEAQEGNGKGVLQYYLGVEGERPTEKARQKLTIDLGHIVSSIKW
ncbi:hypothetical protein GP644_15985 [Parasedimentitalea maritima]|uniref:Uncharacterized protein n=1 Tax=Parasedimentitalea maritima TaxID=2578117 RepID=A0A6A4RD92_9RHOB|nr:hypothetical protein GP644_15985 [Zongyanglinia marina]